MLTRQSYLFIVVAATAGRGDVFSSIREAAKILFSSSNPVFKRKEAAAVVGGAFGVLPRRCQPSVPSHNFCFGSGWWRKKRKHSFRSEVVTRPCLLDHGLPVPVTPPLLPQNVVAFFELSSSACCDKRPPIPAFHARSIRGGGACVPLEGDIYRKTKGARFFLQRQLSFHDSFSLFLSSLGNRMHTHACRHGYRVSV